MIQDRKGFTLLELMVIVALISILVTMAFPTFTGYMAQERVKRVARDLQSELTRTRIHSMERTRKTTVDFLDTGKGWSVVEDGGDTLNQKTIDTDVTIDLTSVPDNRIPFGPDGFLADDDDYRTDVMTANTSGEIWPITIVVSNSSLTMTLGVSIAGASRIID